MSELTRSMAPDKLRPWHEMVAEMFILNPNITQREVARQLGRSEGYLSIVMNCDAFKEYMASRKEEIVDPLLRATVEDRLTAVANVAAEKLIERLMIPGAVSTKELIDATKMATTGLGMGPSSKVPAIQQNLYVIPAPARPQTATEWAQIVEQQSTGGRRDASPGLPAGF